MAAVAERYLIVTHIKNKESKKRPFRICLSVILCLSSWKNINKKGRNFFVTSWQYSQFGQDGRKKRTFSERWDEYEIPVKNLENLAIEKICCYLALILNKASAHLYTLNNNVYTRKSSPDNYLPNQSQQ